MIRTVDVGTASVGHPALGLTAPQSHIPKVRFVVPCPSKRRALVTTFDAPRPGRLPREALDDRAVLWELALEMKSFVQILHLLHQLIWCFYQVLI